MTDETLDSEAYALAILEDRRTKGGKFRRIDTTRCGICADTGRKAGELMSLYITPDGTVAALFPSGYSPSGTSTPSDGPVRPRKLPGDTVILDRPGDRARHSAHCKTCLSRFLVLLEWGSAGVEVEVIPAQSVTFGRVAAE